MQKVNEKNIWIPCVVKKHNQNVKSKSPYVHNDKLNEMCSGFYRGAYATIYVIQSLSKPETVVTILVCAIKECMNIVFTI